MSFNSSMPNFTALNPSQLELSPPEKSSMVPSNAHRVKFVPVYDCDSKIPPQMEPLALFSHFDIDHSSMGRDGKISLSRMPVTCSISTCCASSLPSNFYNHIVNDHPYINIVKLSTHKLANFTICPAGNLIMCHRMFLVRLKNNILTSFKNLKTNPFRLMENYTILAMAFMKIAFQFSSYQQKSICSKFLVLHCDLQLHLMRFFAFGPSRFLNIQ